MRRWIILFLSVITIGFVTITLLQGPKLERDRAWNIIDAVVLVVGIWATFWMFDRVRAIEQRRRDRNSQKYSVPAATHEGDELSTTNVSEPDPPTPATPLSLKQFRSAIRGSLILALVLIFFDVVFEGSLELSWMVCPIWFLVALIRASFGHASARVAVARVLVPVVTVLLVYGNFMLQQEIAMDRAGRIVQACKRYREANGAYPQKLNALIPSYLSSIPVAKYCLTQNDFVYYSSSPLEAILWYYPYPPFGSRVYNLERGDWVSLD